MAQPSLFKVGEPCLSKEESSWTITRKMFGTGRCTRIPRGSRCWSGGRLFSRTEVGGRNTPGYEGVARRVEEDVLEKAKEARAALDGTIERGTHFIAEKAGDVEAGAKAGRETLKETMDTCCH